jgi:hypothetical protein
MSLVGFDHVFQNAVERERAPRLLAPEERDAEFARLEAPLREAAHRQREAAGRGALAVPIPRQISARRLAIQWPTVTAAWIEVREKVR